MKVLAERLLLLRKEKKITQPEAAKYFGVSFPSYCRYEHDERDPSAPTLVAIADFYHVSVDYLLGRTDQR